MIRLAPRAVACAALVAAPTTAADPVWEPGNSTTSTVSPEVEGDDRMAPGDGLYGRLSGDIDIGAHAGASVGEDVAGLAAVTAHYFYVAGLYARYADAFGAEVTRMDRSVGFGVSVRPVFLPRWALDAQSGHALLDLTVDSLALGLGAYVAAPVDAALGDERGFELSLGFGVPLMGRADGLWIDAHGLARFPDPRAPEAETALAGLLSLGWHWVVSTR